VTSQLIRMQAKEIAGIFYDENQRSMRFRVENPDQDAYVAANWPHFVDVGISALTMVLKDEATPEHQKQVIYDELCDHWERSQRPSAREVMQATLQPREREDVRHVDASPGLRSVGM
jgi:hypothetical protein